MIETGEAMNKVSGKVVLKLKEVNRPISGDSIALRIQAAVPNDAARKMLPRRDGATGDVSFIATNETATSFAKKYLIAESSDMVSPCEKVFALLRENLRWLGYSHFEWVDDKEKLLHEL